MDEKFWQSIRDEFPVTRHLAYFQSAGMSPLPNCVVKAVTQAYERLSNWGDMYFMQDLERADRLREKLGRMIGTSADNLTFAPNTSTGFNYLAAALKAGADKPFNLVSLMDEFPSSHIPFEYQGIQIKFVKSCNGVYSVDSIMKATDENTLGVVCSYVQYSSGFRLDVKALGEALKEKGLLFILNATQAFPIFDVDVQQMHVDALSVSFHKWGLCGLVGSMLFTSEEFRRRFPLPMAGWLSVQPPPDDFIPTQKETTYQQFEDARQYNFGTMNFQALAGLDAAIDFMETTGRENIRQRILSLTDYLLEKLKQLPLNILSPLDAPEYRSAILLVDLTKGSNAGAVEFLRENHVVTSLRAGKIRISCNFFNNKKDVDRLIEVLKKYFTTL